MWETLFELAVVGGIIYGAIKFFAWKKADKAKGGTGKIGDITTRPKDGGSDSQL